MSEADENGIVDLSWAWKSTAAYEAELRVTVTPQRRDAGTEVRGRLTGPRCPYASTVEIAYPLQAPPGPQPEDGPFVRRVVVPEASPWEPESPFQYAGVIELFQDGRGVDRRVIRTGLLSLSLGPRGLHVNGRPLTLRGKHFHGRVGPSTATELVRVRHTGMNLVVAPVTTWTVPFWQLGQEHGFFVIGVLDESDPSSLGLARSLTKHVSCFGWLAERPAAEPPPGRLGLLADTPPASVPPSVSFLCLPAGQADAAANLGLPVLLRGDAEPTPPVFGTVETWEPPDGW